MEELKSALEEHMDQMADLVQKFSSELRSGLRPAADNFIGFFHAIDWKVCSRCFLARGRAKPRAVLRSSRILFLVALVSEMIESTTF